MKSFVRTLVVAALVAAGIVVPAFTVSAAGTPDVQVTRAVAASTLYGDPVSVTLSAQQTTGPQAYNLTFTDILPAGAVIASSSYPVSQTIALPGGTTKVIWDNVADLATGTVVPLTYSFTYPFGTYNVGAVFTGTAEAFANSDPRFIAKFNATTGVVTPGTYTGSDTDTSATTLVPFLLDKEEPSIEGELLRGVHDHKSVYTLRITNNKVNPTTAFSVVDYLPAGLEFLGCTNVDNSTVGTEEYPGSGRINDTPLPAAVNCAGLTSAATTVTTDPDGAGPLPTAVYTRVDWTALGALAANGVLEIRYAAAIPLRQNVASAGTATANLDNNTGALTTDEQSLTNRAVATGTYAGTVYTDAGEFTVSAEDVAIHKSVSTGTISQGGSSVWTLDIRSSEYALSTGTITVVDTIPDGLDYTTSSLAPSVANVTNPDGTITVTWAYPAFAAPSSTGQITLTTTARSTYRNGGGPVSSNDSWTNSVSLATTATIITSNTGTSSNLPITDASSAGQVAGGVSINKEVAQPSAVPTTCGTGSGFTFSSVNTGPFHPGDRVCYRLSASFPSDLDTLNNVITDFLPAGVTYESFQYTLASTVNSGSGIVFKGTAGNPVLSWNLGAVDVGTLFQVVVTTRITDVNAVQSGDITANLMKMTYTNTGGEVFQLRDLVETTVEEPQLDLSKGIIRLNTVAVIGAPVDSLSVQANDRVTYQVSVTNSGGQDATNVSVRDILPAEIACADVSNISDSGVCDGANDWINWTIATVAAGATVTRTYDVVIPTDASAGDAFVNTAGVRRYEGATNTGTPQPYIPSSNIDPTLEPQANTTPAIDTAQVTVASATVTKGGVTSITEAGNTAGQATIGELITYTVTGNIPQGSTLYGTAGLRDVIDSRLVIVGTPTYTINGGSAINATVVGNTVTTPLTTPYVNAAGSGTDVILLTIVTRVRDASGPVRGNVVPNRGEFIWDNAASQPRVAYSGYVDIPIVEPLLTIPKSSNAVAGQVVAGQLVTYTLALTNGNAANVSTAHDMIVTDNVPTNIQPTDAGGTPVSGNQTLPGGGVWNEAARTITFAQATLAPNTVQNFTYQARVTDPLLSGSTIVNTVGVTGTSIAGVDPNERTSTSPLGGPGSGYQSTSSVTLSAPEITLTKDASPATRTIGEVITYTVNVTIPANVVAFDATIIDSLATNTRFGQFVSSSCLQGGGACSPAAAAVLIGAPTATDTSVGFFIGDLPTPAAAARVVTITYTGIVTSGAVSGNSLVNSARPYWNTTDTITGTPATIPAPGSFGDNSAADTATVIVVEPLLTIDKDVAGQVGDTDTRRAKPGEALTYTIAVTNSGTSPAYDVTVTDTPNPNVTNFTAGTAGPGTVTLTDGTVADGTLGWSIPGPIAVGATVTITYTVTMPLWNETNELIAAREIINTADVPHYYGVDPALQVGGITYKDYNNVVADVVSIELDLASIGDRVWFDVDNDGVQDSGEPGLANVGVTVVYFGADGTFGTADDETATTTTDSSGNYLVSNLPGGTYRVTVNPATLPAGMAASYDLDGGTATPNGVWQGALAENAAKRDVDFGYTGTGSLGDRVWFDQDRDGVQDANEPGLPGATVTVVSGGLDGNLATTGDNITYTTTTGANGAYLVSRLPAGPYTVTVTGFPTGYSVVADPSGGTSNVSTTSLTAGQNRVDQDFGYAGTGSIGDFVWLDRNGDGIQDATEPGIVGSTVQLTWFGVDGIIGGGDDAVFTTTTDASGNYLFENLLPGRYSVAVTGGLPDAATNSFDRDGNLDSVAPVTLAAGENVRDADFGYDVVSIIGDRVWWDRDSDGVQDSGEPGISGVGIRVTYFGADGVAGGGDDLVFTTTTGANGAWSVTDIPDGNFLVEVTGGVPAGFAPTYDYDSGIVAPDEQSLVAVVGSDLNQDFGYSGSSSIGDTVWLDLDADGVQDALEPGLAGVDVELVWFGPDGVLGGGDDVTFIETTDASGTYLFDGLPAGEYSVTVDTATIPVGLEATYDLDGGLDSTTAVTLPANTALDTVDFGYIGTGEIGDTVWLDQNGDGIVDASESGIAGVLVTLTWAGLDGTLGTADDVVSTTTTDADGEYLFDRLPAGLFTVELSNLPTGILATFDPDGGFDDASQLTLTGGESNLDQDFGYRGDAGVGDLLWLDVDNNGVQDTNEPGVPNIDITVTSSGADGLFGTADDIIVVTTTDAAGNYLVEGLPAGDVIVSYVPSTLPSGYVPRSDLDGGVLYETTATLIAGETRLDVDFVVVGSATLNGIVFDDKNGNGIRDPGDDGIPGAKVVVVWTGPNGPVTVTVTTDVNGSWELTTLPSGVYSATLDLTSVDAAFRPSTGTSTTVNLPPFGVRSVIQGLTTLPLATTGLDAALGATLAGSLLAGGLLLMFLSRRRRRVQE